MPLPNPTNFGEFSVVRFLTLLIALAGPLHADLLAHVQTTLGNVDVVMQYATAPQAVANFITLAQGTRSHVNPLTGAIIHTPYYIGEKFFRVINDPSFKIAQTGSGTGTNSGGPGYTFRDEFTPSLTHVPYVLSMANSGPHTNGSQIFFTGNATIPHLDNVHTIFGLVTEPASRVVIDAIHAAGDNGTTITGITFSRTDAAAIAFNEHSQNLAICSGIAGNLSVNIGVKTDYSMNAPLPAGTVFQAYRSPNLQSWTKLGEIYQGLGQSGFTNITLDGATLPRAFYQIPLATYQDALAPASLVNRTLVMGLHDTQTITFQFDANGTGGTAVYSETPTAPTPITGVNYYPSPYKATWIIQTVDYNPYRIEGVLNTISSSYTIGTNKSERWNGASWSPFSSGSLTLTR